MKLSVKNKKNDVHPSELITFLIFFSLFFLKDATKDAARAFFLRTANGNHIKRVRVKSLDEGGPQAVI